MIKDCCFCDEIESGTLPTEFRQHVPFVSRTICRSANFLAMPSASPLATGHVLVIPRVHWCSTVQVKAELMTEFLRLFEAVRHSVESRFGPSIVFEHGIGRGKIGGCGVNHAHVHVLPMENRYAESVLEALRAKYVFEKYPDLQTVFAQQNPDDSYLLLGLASGSFFVTIGEQIESQCVRKLVATVSQLKSWDWREYASWDKFEETYRLLSNAPTLVSAVASPKQ